MTGANAVQYNPMHVHVLCMKFAYKIYDLQLYAYFFIHTRYNVILISLTNRYICTVYSLSKVIYHLRYTFANIRIDNIYIMTGYAVIRFETIALWRSATTWDVFYQFGLQRDYTLQDGQRRACPMRYFAFDVIEAIGRMHFPEVVTILKSLQQAGQSTLQPIQYQNLQCNRFALLL